MLRVAYINKDRDEQDRVVKELAASIFNRLQAKWDREATIRYLKEDDPEDEIDLILKQQHQ